MEDNYKNIYAVVDEDAIKNNWGRPVDRTDVWCLHENTECEGENEN